MSRIINFIIVLVEIGLYLIFRSEILYLFEKLLPNNNDLEVNIYSSLIIIFLGFLNIWIVNTILKIVRLNKPKNNYVKDKIELMRNWIFSTKAYWAPKRNDEDKKVANTVEGLFMFIYKDERLNSRERIILNQAYNFIIDNISEKGLPSLSIKLNTVHCTAFGLYIIQKLKSRNLITCTEEQEKKTYLLINSLINSSNKFGWGFITERNVTDDEIRIPFTFWVLRALNLTEYYNHEIISNTLNSLISLRPNCMFGYNINGNPKVCSISLFLILTHELRNSELKKEVLNEIKLKPLLEFIIEELLENNFIEFEEYDIKRYNLSGVEELSWNHISVGYALEALSIYYNSLSNINKIRLNSIVKKIMKKNIHETGFFFNSKINIDFNNPHIYPTAYVVGGIYSYYNFC